MRSLRILRAIADVKSKELAQAAGVTATYLSHVEAGREALSAPLALRLIEAIEDALDKEAPGVS